MNGYLVVLRCMFDDHPLRLCETRDEAEIFAETVEYDGAMISPWRQRSDASHVAIVRFINGIPADGYSVKDFRRERVRKS